MKKLKYAIIQVGNIIYYFYEDKLIGYLPIGSVYQTTQTAITISKE